MKKSFFRSRPDGMKIRRLSRPLRGAVLSLALAALAGCSHKHTGAGGVTADGRLVDPSWVTATESCWPDLIRQGFTAASIQRDLADTTELHNAFPVYAAQTQKDLADILAKPLQTGPDPDISRLTHSHTPVLTRGQAAAGTVPQMAVVQNTNGLAPPDAFCSIQPGIPQGFSK